MMKNLFLIDAFATGGGGSGRRNTPVRRYNSSTGNMTTRGASQARGRGTLRQQAARSRNASARNALQALGVR